MFAEVFLLIQLMPCDENSFRSIFQRKDENVTKGKKRRES
jgi:hypothetical protein